MEAREHGPTTFWMTLRGRLAHGRVIAGLGAALLLLLALLSFSLQDPTLFNLRQPAGGISNGLGFFGALLAGSVVELLGPASLLLPLLVANWTLQRKHRPLLRRYLGHGLVLVLAGSALHALRVAPTAPSLTAPGVLGWLVAEWARATVGATVGDVLCAVLTAVSVQRVSYGLPWAAVGRESWIFLRYGGRRTAGGALGVVALLAAVGAAALGVAQGTARAFGQGGSALRQGAHRKVQGLQRRVQGLRLAFRFSTLGRIKAQRRSGAAAHNGNGHQDPAHAGTRATEASQRAQTESDGFDSWFSSVNSGNEVPTEKSIAALEAARNKSDAASNLAMDRADAAELRSVLAAPAAKSAARGAAQPMIESVAKPAANPPANPVAGGNVPGKRVVLVGEDVQQASSRGAALLAARRAKSADGDTASAADLEAGSAEAWERNFELFGETMDLDWQQQNWRRDRRGKPEGAAPAKPSGDGN